MRESPSALSFCSGGFLPKELPPCFSVESFSQAALDALGDEHSETIRGNRRKGKKSAYSRHNLARAGMLRRRLGIPNPVAHAWLSKCIEENWNDIDRVFSRSEFSCTKPFSIDRSSRAFDGLHQNKRLDKRAEICAASRMLVKADISRFYHSIYTHSIPWAVHGKHAAKANQRDTLWGNRLDRMFRHLSDKQTVGIPIGPDSSQIAAELILCDIDSRLQEQFPNVKGYRFIDDYEFAVDSLHQGEQVLHELQNLLTDYELELNPLKTAIHELPIPFEEQWVHKLRRSTIDDPMFGHIDRKDIIALFDTAFVEQKRNPKSSVLRYALRGLPDMQGASDEIHTLCEQIVCQCAIVEPSTMRYGFHVLEQLYISGYEFAHFFEAAKMIIHDAAKKGHGSELCWVLYALLRFRNQDSIFENLSLNGALKGFDDPCVMLLVKQCVENGLLHPDEIDGIHISQLMTSDSLWGSQWLFAYEAGVLNDSNYLNECAYFSSLKAHGVRFCSEVGECMEEEIELPYYNDSELNSG